MQNKTRILIICLIAIVLITFSAGCVEQKIIEPEHQTLTNDKIVGIWKSQNDQQNPISQLSGFVVFFDIFPDFTLAQEWYRMGEYVTTTNMNWEIIDHTNDNPKAEVTSLLTEEILYVDESEYTYKASYTWATMPFVKYFNIDENGLLVDERGETYRPVTEKTIYISGVTTEEQESKIPTLEELLSRTPSKLGITS